MGAPFTPSRSDGRSDRRVVYELVSGAPPDTHFDYPTLADAVSEGLDEPATHPRVLRAVRAANATLLKQDKRSLGNIPGKGYRVLRADEHLPVAVARKNRADHQLDLGMKMLEQVHFNELSPTQRKAHEGQFVILGALYQMSKANERRIAGQEAVIDEIRRRVDRLEGAPDGDTAGQG